MSHNSANERTFQGELYRIINKLVDVNKELKFLKVTQEENVGISNARFADGKLYSSINNSKVVSFELKNANWDATDEILVKDAAQKANNRGFEYFVTGTPRQLVIYKTFIPGIPLNNRKLKIYNISNIKDVNKILLPAYETQITPKIKEFLSDLSNLVHDIEDIHWDGIDTVFVNKLSSYILEASAEMHEPMINKIKNSSSFRKKLKQYLKTQDIFNVSVNFTNEDIYNLCQLANYMLFLKLMFYTYLQREVPALNLKVLSIPEDNDLLNKTLRYRFDDVLKHDYESIFEPSILDQFQFSASYLPVLKRNVEEIKRLNFKDLDVDIIGSIYNTLIDNQEQHDRGQHFTGINEVDIICGFCINENTELVLDSSCGAGTFLVRAYKWFKYFKKGFVHEDILEKLWGIEIAPFPVFLSTMNLCLLNIQSFDNYPIIINSDFVDVKSNSFFHLHFANKNNSFKIKNLHNKEADVQIPEFDACIGNPPYIRQELIEKKAEWNKLVEIEWGASNINQRSDLYVYYLMHTSAFLKEKNRLGYVVSSSWLDSSFGTEFQKFLLSNFKIVTIIENQKVRSFETAEINTIILIIEKCSDKVERENNNVNFIRLHCSYEKLIGNSNDINRFDKIKKFVSRIENNKKSINRKDYQIITQNQKTIEEESTVNGKYQNGQWGARYLRAPDVYLKIQEIARDKLVYLQSVIDVKYGIKTGANDFFYLTDETYKVSEMKDEEYLLMFGVEKDSDLKLWDKYGWYFSKLTNRHYMLEREYFIPILKSQKEADNLEVNTSYLKNHILICDESKIKLKKQKKKLLKYIEDAEALQINKRPSISSSEIWYNLKSQILIGDYIFPSKIGERFRLIDNRDSAVACDKVNYIFKVRNEYSNNKESLFAILNSIFFRFSVDLFSRQMVVKVSDVDVNVVSRIMIPNPKFFDEHDNHLKGIVESLKGRDQLPISEEIKLKDRLELEKYILKKLGIEEKDVQDLFNVAAKYVKDRKDKSESLTTRKTKKLLSYKDTLKILKDHFPEINSYNKLIKSIPAKIYTIPDSLVKYPKDSLGSENLFGIYNVYFEEASSQKILSFTHYKQVELFEFLNKKVGVKGRKVKIPINEVDCDNVLRKLKNDYESYSDQIIKFLKVNRSKISFFNIYKDLIL